MPRAYDPSTRIFATAPYEPDQEGKLRARLPSRCPFAGPGEADCRITVHHRRARATGPGFRLDVVRCTSHPVSSFTLYPPGHCPYGRKALVRCSVTSPPLVDAETGELAWDGTVLEAAQQAALGERWPAHSAEDRPGVRRTQGRHLELAGLLLGVHPELGDEARERIATRLRVPMMTLLSAASLWSMSWTQRGAAIALVLAAILVDGALLDRLLSAGYAARLWPRPRRWAPPKRWVIARSAEPERRPKNRTRSRSPPSSSSLGAPIGVGDPSSAA